MQNIALWIAIIGAIIVALAFAKVIAQSGQTEAADLIAKRSYRWRARLFVATLVAGVVITGMTLTPFPHDVRAGEVTRVIDVKGRQWSWDVSDKSVKVGETIEFRVTAEDVSHGFGLYAPDGTMVAQIQAMPGFTNKARYQFTKAGTYRILCMEYCGLVHHGMTADIVASAAAPTL